MSDNRQQDWKALGWQQMKASLDEEMPVHTAWELPSTNKISWAAAVLLISFLSYQYFSLTQQLQDYNHQLAVAESKLSWNKLNNAVSNDINKAQLELIALSNKQGRAKHLKQHKSQKAGDISRTNSRQKHLTSTPIRALETNPLVQKTPEYAVQSEDIHLESTMYPDKIHKRPMLNHLTENMSDGQMNEWIALTKNTQEQGAAKRNKGMYGFLNTRSDAGMYGAMLGMFSRLDLKEKLFIETGLGYAWIKNDYAIQATQIDEVVVTNQSTGVRTTQRVEYPTRIVVNNLHYLQIPVSLNYELTPRFTVGLGLEGRFLINNYYSADPGKDYNLRVRPYTDNNNSDKLPRLHDYDLRKYALGAISNLEYRFNERYSLVARHYLGLVNISGDKVYNATNEIRNSSFNAGIKVFM